MKSVQIFFLTDDSIHKNLFFPHFNPCRSHGNDILCVFAWAVRCPSVRKRLRDDLGGFNTTLSSCSDSSVKLSLSPAWGSHLPNSRWLPTRYASSRLFSSSFYWNVWFSKPVDSKLFLSENIWFSNFRLAVYASVRLLLFGLYSIPSVTWGALKAPCGLTWVPALLCFFNRGRKSRVSHPSHPLPGAQTTGEESTSPRAAYEASGQVCIHSSFGQSACCPPLLFPPHSLSSSLFHVCLLILTPHAFSLHLPHSHSFHSPFPAVTPSFLST